MKSLAPGMWTVHPPVIYNMVNPHEFQWDNLLEELRSAGLSFESVATSDWLAMMMKSAADGDVERKPAVKLLDYYEREYGTRQESPYKHDGVVNGLTKVITNGVVNGAGNKLLTSGHEAASGLRFETRMSQADCPVLKDPPKLLEDGYIKKFVAAWLPKWRDAVGNA